MVAVAAFVSAPAQATMVAGWDFSQYLSDSQLSVDGATYTDTLSANYSNLDPTFGAGAESAAFGTMYIDGSFGSTAIEITGSGKIMRSSVMTLAGSHSVSPVVASLRPTAAAMSPARTSLISSR